MCVSLTMYIPTEGENKHLLTQANSNDLVGLLTLLESEGMLGYKHWTSSLYVDV